MRKLIFCICLTLTDCNILSAQDNAPLSYLPYHHAINRAELAIAEFKYAHALSIYDSVFSVYPKHFNKDLYNAALCAIHCQHLHKAQHLIMERIAQGADIKTLKANTFKLQPSDFWWPIEQCYDSLIAIAQAKAKPWLNFKSKLNALNEREYHALHNDALGEKGYHAVVYENAQQLYRIIDSMGIPPIAIFENHQILPPALMRHHFALRNQLRNGTLDTTLSPYCDMNMLQYDIEPLLLRAVRQGDIAPDIAYTYTTHSNENGDGHLYVVNINWNARTITIEPEKQNKNINIEAENHRRSKFGLPSTEDMLKKDAEIALYYNIKNYPFDEHIRAAQEANYSDSIYNSLTSETEKIELFKNYIESYFKVKSEFFDNISKRIPAESVYNKYHYNMQTIKEFKLLSGGYNVILNSNQIIDDKCK